MRIEIKNLKVSKFASQETICFQAAIYIDGKKAGTAENAGHGGCTNFRFSDKALEQKFYAHCKSLPPIPAHDRLPECPMKAEYYIDELVEKEQTRKWYVTKCRKATLFRLRTDPVKSQEVQWHVINKPFDPTIKTYLVDKYGDQLAEIANETRL